MKVFERVLESKIREQVKINDMQFCFTHGKSTVDAIFIVRQVQEKFGTRDKRLCIHLSVKAFDRV